MIQQMPQLKMADSAILRKKSIISPRNVPDNEGPPSRNLEKKIFPATQNSSLRIFSRTRPNLLSFLFLLTISRPPRGGMSEQKSPSRFTNTLFFVGAGSGIRTHEGVTPNGCHVNRQISRWDLEAVALTTQPSRRNSPTKTGTSLKPFPVARRS